MPVMIFCIVLHSSLVEVISGGWILESAGTFSLFSYCSNLCNKPEFSDFDPADQIWKANVPSKVHLLISKANTIPLAAVTLGYPCDSRASVTLEFRN